MLPRSFGVLRLTAAAFALSITSSAAITASILIQVDIPPDDGLPLGSLFEIASRDGSPIAGAGFTFVSNMGRLTNSRVLTFFVRGANDAVRVEDLGRPYSASDHFSLLVVGADLFSIPYYTATALPPKRYDAETNSWHAVDLPGGDASITNIQAIDGDPFILRQDASLYYRRPVIGDSRWDGDTANSFMFANGTLYLRTIDEDGGESWLYVCDWTPESDRVRNCQRSEFNRAASILSLFPAPSGAGAYITDSRGNTVLVGRDGSTSLRSADGKSFQIYAALRYRDDILLGHYPTGNLFAIRHHGPIYPAIGRAPCSSPYQREAQSLAIHMGEVVVGMWPWGELWTGAPGREWTQLSRVFHHPVETCGEVPYADLLQNTALHYNALGQRIWSMASWRGGAALSTASKWLGSAPAFDLLDPEAARSYGRVLVIERDIEISCELRGHGRMDLELRLSDGRISIHKDHQEICGRDASGYEIEPIVSTPVWAEGPWGRFAGKILGASSSGIAAILAPEL